MTNQKQKQKTRRRWFGRPTDQPGPQETFQGEFQVQTTSPPHVGSSQQTFRIPAPSRVDDPLPAQGPPGSSQRRGEQGRDRGVPPGLGGRRKSAGAHEASAVRVSRLEGDNSGAEAGPSKQRRPSVVVHRATQSNPIVQAAGGNFSRSRSSSVLAAETSVEVTPPVPGPSSLPQGLHVPRRPDTVPLTSPTTYRGPYQHHPLGTPARGPGQYSPPALSPPLNDTPWTGSLHPTYSHYRHGSNDQSPTDIHSWHFPSTGPHTPSSHRGTSIPPSIQSESSPYMELLGDFSPSIGPSDAADVPPLTPERQQFALPPAQMRAHAPFRSAEFSRSSVSVPELDMYFPADLFGSSQDTLAWSAYSVDDLAMTMTTTAFTVQQGQGSTNQPEPLRPANGPAEFEPSSQPGRTLDTSRSPAA